MTAFAERVSDAARTLTRTPGWTSMAVAAAAARSLPFGLYGVTPLDPRTYAAVMVLLTLTAALAAYMPARRAVRIDPARALSQD